MVNRLLVNLYREARRRKVFRTAAYYLVGAWALLQVCDVVFPIIGIPDEALQLVLAATITGFPVALVFGWKYDITPRGIRRTPSIDDVVDDAFDADPTDEWAFDPDFDMDDCC